MADLVDFLEDETVGFGKYSLKNGKFLDVKTPMTDMQKKRIIAAVQWCACDFHETTVAIVLLDVVPTHAL